MRFEDPPLPDRDAANGVFERALFADPAGQGAFDVLIGLALRDEDRTFVEQWYLRIGREAQDPALRGTAALAVGHLARRFGSVSPAAAQMVRELAADAEVREASPQVLDGLSDVDEFAPDR